MLARSRCGAPSSSSAAGLLLAGPFVVGYRLSARKPRDHARRESRASSTRCGARSRRATTGPCRTACSQLGSVHEIISALKRPVHRVPRAAGLPARPAGDRVELHRHRRRACCRRRTATSSSSMRARPGAARGHPRRRHDRAHRRRAADEPQRDEARCRASSARAARSFGSGSRAAAQRSTCGCGARTIHAPVVQARLLSYAGRRWGDVG